MKIIINSIKTQKHYNRLPYAIIFGLFLLQFAYIQIKNAPDKPENFIQIALLILGIIAFQIIRNNKIFHIAFLVLFSGLTFYLILAFMSDLFSGEAFTAGTVKFLFLGLLLFAVLFYTIYLLTKSKPERTF